MNDLKRLVRKTPITPTFAKDVERLRRVLNAHGYDAAPGDIETAWKDWSLAVASRPWHPPQFFDDDQLLPKLLKYMAEPDGSPIPERLATEAPDVRSDEARRAEQAGDDVDDQGESQQLVGAGQAAGQPGGQPAGQAAVPELRSDFRRDAGGPRRSR